MAENRKQHFVPKLHLKNFSVNKNLKTINLFNINSDKFVENKANIDHQCYKDWFYGKDLKLEKALSVVETHTREILTGIIKETLPPRFSALHNRLITFTCILAARTTYIEEVVNEGFDKIIKASYSKAYSKKTLDSVKISSENTIQLILKKAVQSSPILYDLNYKLLVNKTDLSFWTSDNPVIYYNQYLEQLRPYINNTGYVTKGLQIFYAVSPRHCLVFFDENIYGVGNKNENVVEINSVSDVEQLNLIQFIGAKEILYFNEDFNEYYLNNFKTKFKKFRRLEHVFTEVFPNLNEVNRANILYYPIEVRCNLDLSVIRVLRKAQKQSNFIRSNRDPILPRSLETVKFAQSLDKK